MQGNISEDSVVVVAADQICSDLDDGVVILSLKSGVYYSLNEIGSSIWKLIWEPRSVSDIRDSLLEEYDVDAARCQCDLIALLRDMESEGIVEISRQTGA